MNANTHAWIDTALIGGAAYGANQTNKAVIANGAKLDFLTYATLYPGEAKAHLAGIARRRAMMARFKRRLCGLAFIGFAGIGIWANCFSTMTCNPDYFGCTRTAAEAAADLPAGSLKAAPVVTSVAPAKVAPVKVVPPSTPPAAPVVAPVKVVHAAPSFCSDLSVDNPYLRAECPTGTALGDAFRRAAPRRVN